MYRMSGTLLKISMYKCSTGRLRTGFNLIAPIKAGSKGQLSIKPKGAIMKELQLS
jgi:hypothetical protein